MTNDKAASANLLLHTACCKADYFIEDPEYNQHVCSECGKYISLEEIVENPDYTEPAPSPSSK